MPEVTRSVIVGHSPAQMFALIDNVERYPEFLPWCGSAALLSRDETSFRATLEINYRGIRKNFTTENATRPPEEMTIKLVEGPFRTLEGAWRLKALGDRGCRIDFELRYEFSSTLLQKLIGPVFDYIANSLVEAFVKRADRIYG